MPPVIRIGLKWLLTIMLAAASFAFGAGIWKGGIENRLDVHSDSIYVSATKLVILELRTAELQALEYAAQDRIALLEQRVDTLYSRSAIVTEVTLDLYEAVTGQEWTQ